VEVLAVVVFLGALAAIALEWTHRTKVALLGAAVVVVAGVIDEHHAIEAVDWSTLGLLVGMMIIVGLTERTGVFTYIALRVAQLSGGRPVRLVFLLALVTGVMSAFLDNLTAILLVVPITLLLADLLRVSPIPLVLVEVLASNIGGTATLIGDPPNIMIGSARPELSFLDFIVNLAPVAFFTLLTVTAGLAFLYRKQLVVEPERQGEVAKLDPAADMREAPYVKRSLAVLLGTIVGFFLHAPLHLEPAVVALAGATVMLIIAALGSAVVDNIPFTAAMIPVVDSLQGDGFDDAAWWALALGACFGGNATIIAAAANVAASGVLERAGKPISFVRFLLVGVPATAVSLLIATVYLMLFQL